MVTFSGTVESDFLKLIPSDLADKDKLIDFTSSDFASLRDTLISYVKATYPLDYSNFSESDFGMLLIELMAAIGHIQSIKSDYLANESFIRTARSRESVKKLLELVGVRMKGPISAAANAQITIPSAGLPSASTVIIEPGDRVVTVPSPEDGGQLTFTLYKVQSNGSIDLVDTTNRLEFSVSNTGGNFIITDAVLLEGALAVESGVFRSPDTIKSISLSQFPYVERSAQVFIEGSDSTAGIYQEEENIYFASGSSDKVFQVTTNEDFAASIVFGDNTIGKSPSIGDTYTVSYRVGGGTRGNLAAEYINASIRTTLVAGFTRVPADATVENISQATGGADAESIAHAKRYAPLTFRRQDRLVTLTDYKSFTNTFTSNYGSTGKANAVVRRAYSSANIIDLYVLEKASNSQLRKATPEYKRQLLEAIKDKKMLTDEPVVVDGLIRTLDVIVTITLDERFRGQEAELKALARGKIQDYFNIDNTDFGQAFSPQDLVRYILEVNNIRFASVDNIDKAIKVSFNEIIQLNNLTINVAYI